MSHRPVVIKLQLGALNNLRSSVRNAPQRPPQRSRDMSVVMATMLEQTRRAWQWLQQKRAEQFTSRRLRLAETMSLGEKRFVSIVQVDGVEMLVAGSPGNVTLLKVLDPRPSMRPQMVARMEQSS